MNIFKKQAFTLVEGLLTMTILGIVAVLTLPILSEVLDDKNIEVTYKKSISVLTEAIQLIGTKEVPECNHIETSEDLAECFLPVYIRGTLRGNTIDVIDTTSYTFFWRKGSPGSFADCGRFHGNTEADWTGENANCVVTIDVDGKHKNSKKADDLSQKGKIGAPSEKDLFPCTITRYGARPVFYTGSLGYKYSFQKEAISYNRPWLEEEEEEEEEEF